MNQRQRLLSALVHLAILVGVSWALFGVLVPPLGSAGAWFYAGIATLLMSTALTEPHFARPADAVANGIAAVLVAVTYSSTVGLAEGASIDTINTGKVALAVYGFFVAALGIFAILTKDGRYASLSEKAARYCRTIGSGRVVYSSVYLLSVYATYSRNASTLAVLIAAWIVVVVVRPGDWIASSIANRSRSDEARATVVGVRNPRLIEISAPLSVNLHAGDVLRFDDAIEGVVLDVSANETGIWSLVSVGGDVLPAISATGGLHKRVGDEHAMLGVVEPGTDIQSMRFRAPGNVARVREGSVVRVRLRDEDVLYQVVGATIRRETLSSPIEHRFVEIETRKIGRWLHSDDRFRSVAWLPQAGHPAYLETSRDPGVRRDYIGTIPDTDFGIRIDADQLITHNTAILGILGIGKTYLAFELIRRILIAGRKVIVLDITGQYAKEFADVYPPGSQDQATAT